MSHPSHDTYISDSSLYDEKCRQCRRTDRGTDLDFSCPDETPEHKAERQKAANLEPGFYWTRFSAGDDWEPASWNGGLWLCLGTDMPGDDFPAEIGERISEPTARVRRCRQCHRPEGEPHPYRHIAQYE